MLILSLFPGIGLLDMAFEQRGFCVVRGPDRLWGGDVKTFHPPSDKFDGIIGGPPCQHWSRMQHIVSLNRQRAAEAGQPGKYPLAENLIPEFVRVVTEAQPMWWLMENTPDVPESAWPQPPGYHVHSFLLNNRWLLDTTPQNRQRRFWFAHRQRLIDLRPLLPFAAFEPVEYEYAVLASGSGSGIAVRLGTNGKPKRLPKNISGQRRIEDYLRLQDLPDDFLSDAPLTVAGKRRVLGNGVPLPMGRALASAIYQVLTSQES